MTRIQAVCQLRQCSCGAMWKNSCLSLESKRAGLSITESIYLFEQIGLESVTAGRYFASSVYSVERQSTGHLGTVSGFGRCGSGLKRT